MLGAKLIGSETIRLKLGWSRKKLYSRLNSLREALQQLVSDDRYRSLCDALLICGYSDMPREAYAPLLAWRDEAAALGVSQL